jgi:hypothetical protein
LLLYGLYAHRPNTITAAGEEQAHSVICVDLPTGGSDVEQPSFGNKSFEKGKETPVIEGLTPDRHRECDKLVRVMFNVGVLISEDIFAFIGLDKTSSQLVVVKYIGLPHGLFIFLFSILLD